MCTLAKSDSSTNNHEIKIAYNTSSTEALVLSRRGTASHVQLLVPLGVENCTSMSFSAPRRALLSCVACIFLGMGASHTYV